METKTVFWIVTAILLIGIIIFVVFYFNNKLREEKKKLALEKAKEKAEPEEKGLNLKKILSLFLF